MSRWEANGFVTLILFVKWIFQWLQRFIYFQELKVEQVRGQLQVLLLSALLFLLIKVRFVDSYPEYTL